MGNNQNTANILQGLNLIGGLVQSAMSAYSKMREEAKLAGIPDSELDAADARFMKRYADPLAGQGGADDPSTPPNPPPASGAKYDEATTGTMPSDDSLKVLGFAAGDRKFRRSPDSETGFPPEGWLILQAEGGMSNPSWPYFKPAGTIQ